MVVGVVVFAVVGVWGFGFIEASSLDFCGLAYLWDVSLEKYGFVVKG